ncbi:hypothetical protein LF599_08720 [Pseudodesulfovibrio thermohalotolerans]|uniref:hypothetical protein n=1 Tax=Pseudodesulfovibrio thermohalotolerans TaxID=2880651 RepID=UPI0022BA0104|nr:hypothetical protein [Pseudodesulfovibrio thermohalotolerans]WFS64221.1 hypothetical protein LF599_08720 [Pseudodesulfovibrio thermohalotolerans]
MRNASIYAFADWIKGNRDKTYNWEASWEKYTVNESEWRALLKRIANQAERLANVITRHATTNPESAWGAAGALAHTAFHMGAIQMKADLLLENT